MLFAVLVLATFMDGFDDGSVSVVLPSVASFFDIGTGDVSWVVTVYFLFMTAMVLIVGKICMRGGVKKVLLAGFALFSIGASVAFASPSFDFLLVARALQGMGSSMLWCSAAMLAVLYLPRRMVPMGFAASTAGEALGAIAGPLAGGFIAQYVSWEWVFLVNIPVGIMALALSWRVLPKEVFQGFRGFDLPGAVLLFVSLFSGMYCIETAAYDGVTSVTMVLVAVFVITLVLFLMRTRNVEDPLVDLSLFRIGRFDMILVIYTILVLCGMGISYTCPFYISVVMGLDSVRMGFMFLIPGIVTLLMCPLSGRLVVRYGTKPFIVLCCIILIAESACFINAEMSPLVPVVVSLILGGMLWAFVDSSTSAGLVDAVPDEKRPAASTMDTFICYLGISVGSAFYFALLTIGSNSMGTPVDELPVDMFVQGYELAICAGIVLCVVALVLSLILRKDPVTE